MNNVSVDSAGSVSPPSFRVLVEFLHGKYDAATSEGGAAEWPPHPYRLFSALRAAAAATRFIHGTAFENAALDTLMKLERCPPPTVWASEAVSSHYSTFVPVIPDSRSTKQPSLDVGKHDNRIKADSYPAITTSRGRKFLQASFPVTPYVAFDISAGDLREADLKVLDDLLAEVAYLGRSTSPVLLRRVDASQALAGLVPYVPGQGSLILHSWKEGILHELDDKWLALTQDRPMAGRVGSIQVNYGPSDAGSFRWLAFEPEQVVPYRALRQARREMAGLIEALPQGTKSFLLANVGNKYANGRLGLAVRVPEYVKVGVVVGRLQSLKWRPAGEGRWLKARHWTRRARTFATATPIWDGERHEGKLRQRIEKELAAMGDVEDFAMTRHPMLAGCEGPGSRDAWHVAVKFASELPELDHPRSLQGPHGILLPLGGHETKDEL